MSDANTTPAGVTAAEPAPAPAPLPDLSAAQFLTARPRKVARVDLPELGGAVYVRELNGKERDALEDSMVDERGRPVADNLVRARCVAAWASAADGTPLLTPAYVDAVGKIPMGILDPVFEGGAKLNRWRASDRADEKKG